MDSLAEIIHHPGTAIHDALAMERARHAPLADAQPRPLAGQLAARAAEAQARQANPTQPEATPVTFLGTVHRDLSNAGAAIEHAWPILTKLATNPLLDELVEAALAAAGAGVAEEVFIASTDAFKAAAARKAGAVDQVAAAVDAGQDAAHGPETPPQPVFTPSTGSDAQPAQPQA